MTGAVAAKHRLRVAIIGVGPKGLFALERLLSRVPARALVDIDLFEPHRHPGAGPVYDPDQPEFLRMNYPADRVSVFGGDSHVGASDRLSFDDWRSALRGDDSSERYVPRALVGRYLAHCLTSVRRDAPDGVRVAIHRAAVTGLRYDRGEWTLTTAPKAERRGYDEVLMAIGHTLSPAPSNGGTSAPAALIPAVFPVTTWLSRERVAPGSTVAVRGFALTFIDAALALTEGRGGTFSTREHPYRLDYSPSSGDAALILPFSRSGRPALAKPDPALTDGIEDLETITRAAAQRILALPAGHGAIPALNETLAIAAGASLSTLSGADPRAATAAARDALEAGCAGIPLATPLPAAEELERSLAVGAGLHPPGLSWALGHVWRETYGALVARLGGTGLDARDWRSFARLAGQMERLAFGPPAINAAKLLALVEAGRVDLSHVRAGRIEHRGDAAGLRSDAGWTAVDRVVDAVLPAPGAVRSDSGLPEALVAAGHARIARGRRGLEVSRDGACIGRDGRPTPGLSAVGRPTEDWVIGNDTLNRELHPHADLWAQRVARRAQAAATLHTPSGVR